MRARAPTALRGTEIGGRFRLLDLLGTGGIGHVWLAERMAARRRSPAERVALKVLRAEHAATEGFVDRLEREALLAQRVAHPNVLHVLEVAVRSDATEHLPYFVMELLEGADLADTLAWAGKLAPDRAVRIAVALAGALAAAHDAGVIHRDVKPENVFLVHAPDGREIVKLVDFGLAWAERDEPASGARPRPQTMGIEASQGGGVSSSPPRSRFSIAGTPEYMAPELVAGAAPTRASDVYAVGVMLHEMLTGRLPFAAPSHSELARLHREARPPSIGAVSRELAALVARAMAKHPLDRFGAMRDLRDALLLVPEAVSIA